MHSPHSNPQHSNERRLFDEFSSVMTGGKWPVFIRVCQVAIKVNAMYMMVFLRKRIGLNMFGFAPFFFAGIFNFIVFLISQEYWSGHIQAGRTDEFGNSGIYLMNFMSAFNAMFLIKWIIAVFSLRSTSPLWYRHRSSIGESLLYPLIYRLLKPFKLAHDRDTPYRFWRMTEAKWMQYVEPLVILLLGVYAKRLGYVALGHSVIFAAICLFIITFQAYTNSALPGQSSREAEMIRPLISPDEPSSKKQSEVIRD